MMRTRSLKRLALFLCGAWLSATVTCELPETIHVITDGWYYDDDYYDDYCCDYQDDWWDFDFWYED